LVCGRKYPTILKQEDTTSGEDTTSFFNTSVFGRQYSTIRIRENATSGTLDNSVDCSKTNAIVMPKMTGECSSIVEAVCSVVLITSIESD
jgi:hypothetical protein